MQQQGEQLNLQDKARIAIAKCIETIKRIIKGTVTIHVHMQNYRLEKEEVKYTFSQMLLLNIFLFLCPLVVVGECHGEGDGQDQDFHPHDSSMVCIYCCQSLSLMQMVRASESLKSKAV